MKTTQNIELNNGKIIVTTTKEHTFSELEKDILKKLAVNGYYESKYVDMCDKEAIAESNAMYNLCHLDLAEESEDAWKYTINVPKDNEEVGKVYLTILNKGI